MRTSGADLHAVMKGGGRSVAGASSRGLLGSLVIAEVAQAHDGSLGMAHAFIDAIANAGAPKPTRPVTSLVLAVNVCTGD